MAGRTKAPARQRAEHETCSQITQGSNICHADLQAAAQQTCLCCCLKPVHTLKGCEAIPHVSQEQLQHFVFVGLAEHHILLKGDLHSSDGRLHGFCAKAS